MLLLVVNVIVAQKAKRDSKYVRTIEKTNLLQCPTYRPTNAGRHQYKPFRL